MYVYAKQIRFPTMICLYMYCTFVNTLYISSLSSLRKTYTFAKKIKMLWFFQILRIGVTGVRYVSLPNARSWVIHNFRDTRGRGRLQQTVDDLVRYLYIKAVCAIFISLQREKQKNSFSFIFSGEKNSKFFCKQQILFLAFDLNHIHYVLTWNN